MDNEKKKNIKESYVEGSYNAFQSIYRFLALLLVAEIRMLFLSIMSFAENKCVSPEEIFGINIILFLLTIYHFVKEGKRRKQKRLNNFTENKE